MGRLLLTAIFLALFLLALAGAFADVARGRRPALLARPVASPG
jgi:hypothetical protein